MADPSMFDPIRIPAATLAALDWRPFHFALQPVHYLVRLLHIVATSAFFGAVVLLDLRLMGWRKAPRLRELSALVLPWLWLSFGVAAASGLALFLYDPVRVGAHAYWAPKLLAVAMGMANAALFHRTGYVAALAAEGRLGSGPRLAGGVSLALWTAALAFASLDAEGVPRVLLR